MKPAATQNSGPVAPDPLFRWAGGKRRLLTQLAARLPCDMNGRVYFEPFLGSGALALKVLGEGMTRSAAYLRDGNWQIYNLFDQVRCGSLERLDVELRSWAEHYAADPRGTFSECIRVMEDARRMNCVRAAAFLVVQQASWNGLWRVNSKGKYNVPFGKRKSLGLPSYDDLWHVRRALEGAVIEHGDAIEGLKLEAFIQNDCAGKYGPRKLFCYIDPPYLPENEGHTRYLPEDFKPEDHVRLVRAINALASLPDTKIMVSAALNSVSVPIYAKLDGFTAHEITVHRSIAADGGKRGKVSEMLYLNYDPFVPGDL